MENTHSVTRLLQRWKVQGDDTAEEELFRVVQRELLRLAQSTLRRNPGFAHKLDPHELLSEAYLTLRDYEIVTAHRGAFFALMSKAMRNILIDIARRDRAAKRPSTTRRVMDEGAMDGASVAPAVDAIAFYEAFDLLQEHNPRAARMVEHCDWFGLTISEVEAAEGVSAATVKRDLSIGRAFLRVQLTRTIHHSAPAM